MSHILDTNTFSQKLYFLQIFDYTVGLVVKAVATPVSTEPSVFKSHTGQKFV